MLKNLDKRKLFSSTLLILLIFIFFQNCSKGFEVASFDESSLNSSSDISPVGQAPECQFDGQAVAEGVSVTAYQVSTVPSGQSCPTESRTCQNGALTGTFQFSRCEVGAPAACLFNGQTIASSESVTAYQASTVPFGQSCISEARTCSNGNLSGSYTFGSCTPGAPAACIFNGQTIAHNQTVRAYLSETVPYGQSCVGQDRTCNNGALSGTAAFSSCLAQPAPRIRRITAGWNNGCVLLEDRLKCWGAHPYAKIFDPLIQSFGTPASPSTVIPTGIRDTSIRSGYGECHVTTVGALICSGEAVDANRVRTFAMQTFIASGVTSVSLGHWDVCATTSSGLQCTRLDFGSSPTPPVRQIYTVFSDSVISDHAVGHSKVCAIVNNGALKCSSVNGLTSSQQTLFSSGASKVVLDQPGNACAVVGTDLYCWTIVPITTGSPYELAMAGYSKVDGTVGRSLTPELIMTNVSYVAVAQNGDSTALCAVKTDTSVQCWGSNPEYDGYTPYTLISSGVAKIEMMGGRGYPKVVQMLDGSVRVYTEDRLNNHRVSFTSVNLD